MHRAPTAIETPEHSESSRQVRTGRGDWAILFASCFILAVAPLLEVHAEGRVGVRGFPRVVLPPSCASRELFGTPCPGCGLTRSFVYFARGDVANSLASHRLGWLVMLIILLQIPYRLYLIYGSGTLPFPRDTGTYLLFGLLAALVINWLIGMCGLV